MSSIDEIKSRIDILDLVNESGVKLRRAGKNYTGFCPFHPNTRTPAFVVFPESGTWRCFGQCNEGGDVFKFVMKKEGWDFPEALRRLAEKAGVQLEAFSSERQEQKEEHARLRTLLEDCVTFYRHQLMNTPAGGPVLDYLLEKRKLTRQTVETFGLGYAPVGWDHALTHFKEKGFAEQDLLEAGLLSERDSGGTYDRFRHRLMIPIRDAEGRMAGFGARVLDPNDQPKFLNSPQTVLFDKGRLLYGLDRARKPIRAADQVVIVEGYLDVIALHQAGFENVVSPMGTALTEDQIRLLKRFSRRIVLALDPDAAGQKAVLHGLEAARASLDHADELGFDARGLLRHEARLQADLRVASMPDELDPDEIVQRNPDEWKQLIAEAQPIVTHVMETLARDRDINDPKVKAEIAAQVLPLIEDLPNPVERDTYRQRLARRLRVDERALTGPQPAGPKPLRRVGRTSATPARKPSESPMVKLAIASPSRRLGAKCLEMLLQHPDLLHRVDRNLQAAGLASLSGTDFGYTDHQIVFRLLQQSLEQDVSEVTNYIEAHLDEDLRPLFAELLGHPVETALKDKILDEILRCVIQLRSTTFSENRNQLRYLQEEAMEGGDARASAYGDLLMQQTRALKALDDARRELNEHRKN